MTKKFVGEIIRLVGEAVHIVQDQEQASVMLHPLRLQILELASEPSSATSLSPRLGLPRQQVNYHLRELERVGLVEFVEERKRGNCIERLYRSTARSYIVAPAALTGIGADPTLVQDRRSAEYLVALGARLIQDVADAQAVAPMTPTLAIETEIAFGSDAERSEFAKALAASVSELAARFHRPSGEARRFRMVTAVHERPPQAMKEEQR